MEYWPWWIGGGSLAFIAVFHWLVLKRLMAVSGRFTALIDRIRFGAVEEPDMSTEEMAAALAAMTAAAFGESPD